MLKERKYNGLAKPTSWRENIWEVQDGGKVWDEEVQEEKEMKEGNEVHGTEG